jgi:transposase
METMVERCCGLDVHQKTVVACLLVGEAGTKARKEVRHFRTMTADLLALRDWLLSQGCTHVGMESTGVYWKPVHAILEDSLEIVVGNAHHIKNVPGRKTDVKDCEWIANLLRHGLIRKSFVPPKEIRELRDLVRYRRKLVESRTAERNRLLKLLETANIKLASVASNVFGVSGKMMLEALAGGEATAEQMAAMALGRLRDKRQELGLALTGAVNDHHRWLLRMQLRRLEDVQRDVSEIELLIASKLEPYEQQQKLLKQIPGVSSTLSAVLIAELGVDMSVFPSASHAAAWAGVCPGNYESAGKRRDTRSRRGNMYLKAALVEAAHAASKKKGSYLKDKFWRLRMRRGPKRAAVAVAHKILVSAYHMLSANTAYRDLGESFLDGRRQTRAKKQLVARLERLGYHVQLTPKAA